MMICVNGCSYRFSMAHRHTRSENKRTDGGVATKLKINDLDHWFVSSNGLQNEAFSLSTLIV